MSKIEEVATAMHKAQRDAMLNDSNGVKWPDIAAYVDSEFYRDMRHEVPAVGRFSSVVHEFSTTGKIGGFPVFEVMPRRDFRDWSTERPKPYHIAVVGWREVQ